MEADAIEIAKQDASRFREQRYVLRLVVLDADEGLCYHFADRDELELFLRSSLEAIQDG